ncbi:MAG: restriction endonuclease subunit S [Phycisphaerales bacterium]|nr:restriction endonuclease subunit S [Phycisphaerales bacterium]
MATVLMGQSPPGSSVNGDRAGVPFLQGNAEFGTRSPRASAWCTQPGRLAEPGDFLISVRAPVGELNIADQQYCIGRGLGAIRADAEDREFLWSALHFERRRLQRVSQGSTFDAIGRDDLEQLPLLMPPVQERRRIGAILASVESAVDATRRVIEQTRRLKTAVLQDLLTRGLPGRHSEFREVKGLGQVPRKWKIVELGEMGIEDEPVTKTGPFGAQLGTKDFRDSGTPVLNIGNVQPGFLDLNELDFIGDKKADQLAAYRLRAGDLVFSRSATIGRTAVVPPEAEGWLMSYHLIRVRLDSEKFIPTFVMSSILNSPAIMRQIQAVTQGGTRSGVNTGILERLRFPMPSREEQVAVLNASDGLRAREVAEENRLRQMHRMKTALSQALLTGRVRVPQAQEVLHAS